MPVRALRAFSLLAGALEQHRNAAATPSSQWLWGEGPRCCRTLSHRSCFRLRLYCSSPGKPHLLLPVPGPWPWMLLDWPCHCLATMNLPTGHGAVSDAGASPLCLILTPYGLMSQCGFDPPLSPQRYLMLQLGLQPAAPQPTLLPACGWRDRPWLVMPLHCWTRGLPQPPWSSWTPQCPAYARSFSCYMTRRRSAFLSQSFRLCCDTTIKSMIIR